MGLCRVGPFFKGGYNGGRHLYAYIPSSMAFLCVQQDIEKLTFKYFFKLSFVLNNFAFAQGVFTVG